MLIVPILSSGQNLTYKDYQERIEDRYFFMNEHFLTSDTSQVKSELQNHLAFDEEIIAFSKQVNRKTYPDSAWVSAIEGKVMQFTYKNKADISFLYLKLGDHENAIKMFNSSLPYSDYHRVGLSPKKEFEIINEYYKLPKKVYNKFVKYALAELRKNNVF